MPANKKYLSSKGERALKISAGFIGGWMLCGALHLAIGLLLPRETIIATMIWTFFPVWTLLMMAAFYAKSGLRVWGFYVAATAILAIPIYLAS